MEKNLHREILQFAETKKVVLERNALEILENVKNYREIIEKVVGSGNFIITSAAVREVLVELDTKVTAAREVVVKKSRFKAKAKDVEPNFRIMEEHDATNQSFSEGKVANFLSYFRDKFDFLSSVLKKRPGFNPKTITQLERVVSRENVETVGMVSRKWVTKKGHIAIRIEDLDEECIVVASKDDKNLTKVANAVVLDDVIGIKGMKLSKEMIIAKEILWPDLEQRPPTKAERDLSAVVISDMHVGSRLFLEKEFARFTYWLNGNVTSEKDKERIGKIKYMFVVGDNVDGVGVYPEQLDELAIKDIFEQYSILAECLKAVPEYIQVFVCPGQHDAVRRADPQPAIPKEFLKDFAGMGNVFFVGSPSWIEVEGLKCLMYHGASLHDLYANVNFLNARKPQIAMMEVLKKRDLMTCYGAGNPYVPEHKDFMLIREEPDFYFGGDMHHVGYDMYRSCLVVNSSTWQKQTEYQLKQGHIPTPGIVPEIELKTRKIRENHFYKE